MCRYSKKDMHMNVFEQLFMYISSKRFWFEDGFYYTMG